VDSARSFECYLTRITTLEGRRIKGNTFCVSFSPRGFYGLSLHKFLLLFANQFQAFPDLHFKYEEKDPAEFFTPYIWKIGISGISGLSTSDLELFNSTDAIDTSSIADFGGLDVGTGVGIEDPANKV
jgi:hypothetical protein